MFDMVVLMQGSSAHIVFAHRRYSGDEVLKKSLLLMYPVLLLEDLHKVHFPIIQEIFLIVEAAVLVQVQAVPVLVPVQAVQAIQPATNQLVQKLILKKVKLKVMLLQR